MKPPFKPSPVELNQRLMFPSNVFDLLKDDHECYLYQDIFKQLDTSELEGNYSELGQWAYHPKLIVSILIYAYSRGVFSSREIERRSKVERLGQLLPSRCIEKNVLPGR